MISVKRARRCPSRPTIALGSKPRKRGEEYGPWPFVAEWLCLLYCSPRKTALLMAWSKGGTACRLVVSVTHCSPWWVGPFPLLSDNFGPRNYDHSCRISPSVRL
ncbi:uncharacterized protein GLRG_04014 [Colletotrichum graminicola M1.001]|uniref:Uncharacterized protein n=1 Tax=Colletotrichum graminicola (strain M1.001 / M2 / FGSC 10212) TaxID=645133 RepID=E3QD98_COLGM|nr:uncharacterized protein GLRG_04014 [Colletotrichum graminicola M1.001]EFQ28870.1 hypothetical protein GLRG_04014 [Colletotrichum graminicola M1.001]